LERLRDSRCHKDRQDSGKEVKNINILMFGRSGFQTLWVTLRNCLSGGETADGMGTASREEAVPDAVTELLRPLMDEELVAS
jgi:hypothetical protein